MPFLHQVWPGTNRFYCGCCVSGSFKDIFASLCWYGTAAVAVIMLSIFIVGKVWEVAPVLPILFYSLVVFTSVMLNLTACTDPGIIPRRPFLQRLKNHEYSAENIDAKLYSQFLSPDLQQNIDGQNKKNAKKQCTTCHIFRPSRASHCSNCGNCVQVYDHHCGFVNNCIGKRNYRFFVLFLFGVFSSMTVMMINLIVFGLMSAGNSVSIIVIIVICAVVFGCIGIPVVGFLAFHIYLTITGKTTREQLKKLDLKDRSQNQWCSVDPPIVDFYQVISEQQAQSLRQQLQKMNPILQGTPMSIPVRQNNSSKIIQQTSKNKLEPIDKTMKNKMNEQ